MERPGNANDAWGRRGLLSSLIFAFGAVGAGGVGWALIQSSQATPDLKPESTDVRFSLAGLPRGHEIVVTWAGRPVLIAHRSAAEVDAIGSGSPGSAHPRDPDDLRLPDYKRNRGRSLRTDVFVAIAVCTHEDCVVTKDEIDQGFACPCCGSRYDLAGRAYMGPAPRNLAIPPYHFKGLDTVVVGQGPVGDRGVA
jgi:ubiquinol-cytochrome c reductase iron-sulfur subunit